MLASLFDFPPSLFRPSLVALFFVLCFLVCFFVSLFLLPCSLVFFVSLCGCNSTAFKRVAAAAHLFVALPQQLFRLDSVAYECWRVSGRRGVEELNAQVVRHSDEVSRF